MGLEHGRRRRCRRHGHRREGTEGQGKRPVRTEYVEQVAARLVEQLRQGAAPWQRPWEPGELRAPYNAATGKEYRGFNSVWLRMQGHGDPRWLTFNQAADAGAGVRKGSRGTQIVYWKFTDERKAPDANGRPALDANGGRDAITVELERPRSFMAVVFNASQIDGLPPPEAMALRPEPERHARAEAIMTGSGARIAHVAGERAFYRPGDDLIVLPPRTQFATADRLYATALHELGHWSGHGSRLDRDLTHPFGSAGYAREELRAEIASLITGERLEIGHDPGQHAAYAAHWIKALEEDPREIFRAAADAGKIADYLMEFEREREQTMEKETGAQQARQTTAVEHGTPAKAAPGRVYLAVPYREKDEARAAAMSAGVRIAFDRDAMAWWAPESADLSPLAKWKADAARVVSQPARSVEEQFGDAIRGAGLALEGLPVMDGNIHRVPVAGEAAGKTSGSYAGHLGGVTPGGYIQNFKSGETVNWKPEGAAKALTPGERARLQAEARQDRARREAALAAKHETAAEAAQALWMAAPPATADNAYCRARAIDNPASLGLRVVPEAVPETAAAHGIRIARNAREAKAMRAAEPDARVFMAGDLLIAGRDID
ncbi:MAG: zincin-like metallopeptidase domain-containing protein, partial [Bradyrhizobium sp.]